MSGIGLSETGPSETGPSRIAGASSGCGVIRVSPKCEGETRPVAAAHGSCASSALEAGSNPPASRMEPSRVSLRLRSAPEAETEEAVPSVATAYDLRAADIGRRGRPQSPSHGENAPLQAPSRTGTAGTNTPQSAARTGRNRRRKTGARARPASAQPLRTAWS